MEHIVKANYLIHFKYIFICLFLQKLGYQLIKPTKGFQKIRNVEKRSKLSFTNQSYTLKTPALLCFLQSNIGFW